MPVYNWFLKTPSVYILTAQICLSYTLHRGIVAIPKTVNPVRISENLKATEIQLNSDDVSRLRAIDMNFRLLTGTSWITSTFSSEDLWDTANDEVFEVSSHSL